MCDSRSMVDSLDVCDGTSVLNDGITPSVIASEDPSSQWASQLFTLRRSGTDAMTVTFDVEIGNRDRVELAVFNCPERMIGASSLSVYSNTVFNIPQTRRLIANKTLTDTSCNHLIKFCVEFTSGTGLQFLILEFPYQTNSNWVFLGEVTFLDGGSSACDPPELIDFTTPPPPTTG